MFTPDFLIIPYAIKAHEDLRPSDGDVYGVIYWFERLKDGKCTASNETIAEVACCGVRNVRGALDRLEKEGFVQRVYSDEARTRRSEIKTLMHYGKIQAQTPGLRASHEPKQETPGDFAKRFFSADPGIPNQAVEDIINNIKTKTGAPEEAIQQEVNKFILYWTEPNKSGTKQRWQTEKTFEVQRRLFTWLSRAGKINKTYAKAGSGRTI